MSVFQLKPSTGFEPAVFALQERCITVMLQGQVTYEN